MSNYLAALAAALPDDLDTSPGIPNVSKEPRPVVLFITEDQKPAPQLIRDILATVHTLSGIELMPVSVERSISKHGSVQIKTKPAHEGVAGQALVTAMSLFARTNTQAREALRIRGVLAIQTERFG